jgi:hypothetical protein
MFLNIKYWFSIICLAALSLTSCGSDDKKDIPDVSGIQAEATFIRFDKALFDIDTNKIEDGLKNLEAQYPSITNAFWTAIIGAKKPNEAPPQYFPVVRQFLTDYYVRKTADTTQIVFKNFDTYQKQLNEAARFYKYYFPKNPNLTFVTFVSQYNYDVFPFGHDTIGIGLDFFLGEKYPDYMQLENARYDYVRRTLTPEHLAAKALRLHIQDMVGEGSGNRLLDIAVHNGKQLYILDKLLPNTPDSIKFGYSGAQTKWCKENEAGIWASFLKENVLYEANFKKIAKLVTPSPNSPGMPLEAPGETGNYIGWCIVEQFMARNPEISLTQLLQLKDAQQILTKAKYKPAK